MGNQQQQVESFNRIKQWQKNSMDELQRIIDDPSTPVPAKRVGLKAVSNFKIGLEQTSQVYQVLAGGKKQKRAMVNDNDKSYEKQEQEAYASHPFQTS